MVLDHWMGVDWMYRPYPERALEHVDIDCHAQQIKVVPSGFVLNPRWLDLIHWIRVMQYHHH